MKIWEVPERFRPENRTIYPKHQTSPQLEDQAENWFRKNQKDIKTSRVYLPIKWTAYHIQHNYGKEIAQLQNYINGLPKNMQFFTVVQYDDGPIVNIPNCAIFAAGGKPDNAIPIPLVCDRHAIANAPAKKEYIASFVGDINTHPIRKKMSEELCGVPGFYFNKAGTIEFENAMSNSYFALCPRGYGKTSFRLYEAMQMGCVPIYISDDHWLPSNIEWNECCCLVRPQEIQNLPNRLTNILASGYYEEMRENAIATYNNLCAYDKVFEYIKERITGK